MELSSRRRTMGWPTAALALTAAVLLIMVPEVASVRYIVGSGLGGWAPNINYTIWARDKHFYNGDWLFFVYDRNQQNVLEVNKTDYENCNSDHPLHNWTTGAGRDVVPLNVTRTYYFISGKGFCYSGMKFEVHVEKAPPPPSASPKKSASSSLLSSFKGQIMVPTLFAVAAVWDAFLLHL
ncbi:OLC1v1009661C1 [Oldenlandia corymbosa var. corymbosa]|uniref:OLC1v1009661C1 n=1 Tax=Oldenlandia corymbosa var. corymbosa TaxID=529605 RepID=A0AAV1DPH0_OLDCO|nr:OLC1v1009661C1 [Oldenlandia corymbosa var. corymbosa]